VESESVVVSLSSNLRRFILIHNSPSLVDSVMSAVDNNLLSFSILSLVNVKNLLVLDVDEVVSSVLEDLPPVRVSAPDLHLL
jgi:hypothetical protein